MSKQRKNGREKRQALKEMQNRSVIYSLYVAKNKNDYSSAKRIGVL